MKCKFDCVVQKGTCMSSMAVKNAKSKETQIVQKENCDNQCQE